MHRRARLAAGRLRAAAGSCDALRGWLTCRVLLIKGDEERYDIGARDCIVAKCTSSS